MGERALRGLYHVLASSLLVIICFVKKAPPDPREYFQPLSTKGLAKRSSFFFTRSFCAAGTRNFQTIQRRAPRSGKAATLPTLQMESRHAASARLSGFRHRWAAQRAQQVRPFM